MAQSPVNILLIGTLDTKLEEFLYLRTRITHHSKDRQINVILIDVGRTPSIHSAISVTQEELLRESSLVERLDNAVSRGESIATLAEAAIAHIDKHFTPNLDDQYKMTVHGMISAGGSGNTALASQVMRDSTALPLGLPKIIVSTVASGDVSHIVGASDIMLMPTIVDVAGLNQVLCAVLDNAAACIVGAAHAYASRLSSLKQSLLSDTIQANPPEAGLARSKRAIRLAITMFGITTPCVDHIRRLLALSQPHVIPYVFHATGTGGRAMEGLIERGEIDAVIDLTTTEIADHVVGGVMSAGPHRLEAALKKGIPCVISVGACDVVNFGPRETVPPAFEGVSAERGKLVKRTFLEHNKSVTLMRTSPDECGKIGEFIYRKVVKFAKDPQKVRVVVPQYFSALSYPDQPLADEEADTSLIEELARLNDYSVAKMFKEHRGVGINDEAFAQAILDTLISLLEGHV